jgi:hypothetical protein
MEGFDAMQEVVDNLFIGPIKAAYNVPALDRHGITHILTLNGSLEAFPTVWF